MKLIFEKEELNRAVTPAMGSVSSKSTIPSIEGILFSPINDSECEIVAYDLEKGFKVSAPCQIQGNNNASFVLNANKINQIIKMMPEGDITIEISERLLSRIYSGKSEFELHAINGKDFPDLPELSGEKAFTVSQKLLADMIRETEFAIANNDPRAALNGLFFLIKGTSITIVSCDGNRLALREHDCKIDNLITDGGDESISFILPGKTVNELTRLMGTKDEDKNVKIMVSHKHAVFNFDDYYFFSRLIDGNYIEYERFIPKTNKTFVKINRYMFIQSLERASLISEDRAAGQTKSNVKLTFEENILKITAVSVTGKVYDEIGTEMEGNNIEIGFNYRYLTDALKSTGVEYVKISMSSPFMSMIIEPAEPLEDERFLFLVLPVKM